MDEVLIFLNNQNEWNSVLTEMDELETEYLILCIIQFSNKKKILLEPLYFSVSNLDYRMPVNKEAILKLSKIVSDMEEDYYPCVIHNHRRYYHLDFSGVDDKFENSMNVLLKKMGNKEVVMILFGEDNRELLIRSASYAKRKGRLMLSDAPTSQDALSFPPKIHF